MELKTIIRIIKRWILLLILGMVVAGGAGYYLSSQETPMYQARTRFVVLRAATGGYDYYAYIDYQQLIETYSQLLSTDALLNQASEELGYSAYGIRANASQIGETQFVLLTVTHQDPVKAAEIANVLVKVLSEQNEQLQSVRYETTERNLQQRVEHAQTQIELLQTQINELSTASVQEQLTQVEEEIDKLQTEIIDIETEIESLENTIADFVPEFSTQEQITQNDAAKARLAVLKANLNQIEPVLGLYQQIYTNLTVLGSNPDGSQTTSEELSQLRTNLNLYQQIYINSISSLESLNLSRAQNTPNVVQVEPASVPQVPISPKPVQSTMLYGAVGLLAMGGVAFLIEYLDDTLKTPDEVKNNLGLPVLGFVADIKDGHKDENKNGLFVANQPRSPVSEAFRAIRTSLEFYSVDRPLHSLLVTSSGPQDGKTTVAANLAIVLAQGNKRVLLLDADMRRPNIHKKLNISNRFGLTDLMRGRMGIKDVIQVSKDIKNLSVITSGSLPPNPADLLASSRMTTIIDMLTEEFDRVIIDSPPAIVTDAQILSTKTDGVLYVIRPGKTRVGAVQIPLEEFRRIDANVIGVIMNRIPRNRNSFYGGYDYYSTKDVANEYYRFEEKPILDQPVPEKE